MDKRQVVCTSSGVLLSLKKGKADTWRNVGEPREHRAKRSLSDTARLTPRSRLRDALGALKFTESASRLGAGAGRGVVGAGSRFRTMQVTAAPQRRVPNAPELCTEKWLECYLLLGVFHHNKKYINDEHDSLLE